MQDYLFFVTASYGFAGCVLLGLASITLWQFLQTKQRYNALDRKKR